MKKPAITQMQFLIRFRKLCKLTGRDCFEFEESTYADPADMPVGYEQGRLACVCEDENGVCITTEDNGVLFPWLLEDIEDKEYLAYVMNELKAYNLPEEVTL